MKITKRQLRRIIKEEKARLREGRMAELEMQLVDEIVDLLIERGAVQQGPQRGYDLSLYTSPSPRDGLLSRMPSSA